MSLKEIFSNENTDEKSLNFIVSSLEKSNLGGFDYIEFVKAVEKLRAMPMDSELAIKSAFSTVSTVGLTKESLLKSIVYYLEILDKERKIFLQSVEDRRLVKIERQNQRIKALEEEVLRLQNRINEIETKIVDYHQEQEEIKVSVELEKEKIELTEKTFSDTLEIVEAQIRADLKIIKSVI